MSETLKAFGIDRLSVDERISLAMEIWDSIEDRHADFPLTDVQQRDLERRWAASKANPELGSTWEEVKARIQNRVRS